MGRFRVERPDSDSVLLRVALFGVTATLATTASFVTVPQRAASDLARPRVTAAAAPASLIPSTPPRAPKPQPSASPAVFAASERPHVNKPDTRPRPVLAAAVPLTGRYSGPNIERYAGYEPQTTCDPTDKPGAIALRNTLLAHYPVTVSFGISRACTIGGRSEHKEGRAFDWGANVNNAAQRAAVDAFFKVLFATDSYGHADAIARRMGIMYVIWNKQIRMVRPESSWEPYTGDSPHTDHVHISMSWAGARAQTSFWSGSVPSDLLDLPETPRPWPSHEPRPSWPPDPSSTPDPSWTPHPIWTPEPTHTPDGSPDPSPTPSDEHHHHHDWWPTPTPTTATT